jgi:hypothetical protein
VVGGDVVNTDDAGIFTITYNVKDVAGNPAVQVTRIVNVAYDTEAPVITLNGENPVNLLVGDSYTDAGATATDDVDVSVIVVSIGIVDTATVGTYTITYTATDLAGNIATATRTVNVVDETAPVLTLPADITTSTTNSSGTAVTFTAPTATDNVDGSVVVTCNHNSGDNFAIGDTTVTCGAVDKAGNLVTGTFKVTVTLTSTGGGGGGIPPTAPPVEPTTVKAGDANGDNKVDEYDFAALMADWGKTGTSTADLNKDGIVDEYDFALLMANWGL